MSIKNAAQLRDRLAENFMAVKGGTLTIADCEAMTNIAGKMTASAIAQIKMAEVNKSEAKIAFLAE